MLFHTWPFLVFLLVVLPVYFTLRRTPLWIPWLLAASYFFYAWWNPYYLLLVVYSTALDYLLVTLMDHCPLAPPGAGTTARRWFGPRDGVLKAALAIFLLLDVALAALAVLQPPVAMLQAPPSSTKLQAPDTELKADDTEVKSPGPNPMLQAPSLRPTLGALAVLVGMMAIGAWMANRRVWLFISIFNNLALLLFFKYARFVIDNLNQVLAWLHVGARFRDPAVLMPHGFEYILPVGISFFTFQSMSYTIDFYLGKIPRERNLLRFATFVCFFPQLMAGPIERARQMLPQLQQAPAFRLRNLTDGASLFLVGLFKKVALANYLAVFVDRVYDNPSHFGATPLVLATVAFAWQIFFDFSGYTDMARGVARMLGFHLVLNFNNPYLAASLTEFWQRWHISLSTWFRDYVYIPLGGNRRGAVLTYRNLLIVFLVSGIWHGSAWTFAIWGLLHAAGVMLTRELERSAVYRTRVPHWLKQAWVFAYVTFAWIFFRAATLSDALLIVRRIFVGAWTSPQVPALMLALVGSVWLYQFLYESRFRKLLGYSPVRIALAASMLLYIGLCSSGGQAFIYFQF